MTKIYEKIFLNRNFKAILNYCFRIFVFLFLCRNFILVQLGNSFAKISIKISDFITNFDEENSFYIAIIIIMFLPYYILPKICGLFKKLDNLNIFLSVFVILLVDLLYLYSHAITIQLFPLKFSFIKPNIEFILIWFFFLYRFLNFLTKKIPTPFKQIGYIFSIELFKDIYKDVKNDIKENYKKRV